MTHAFARFRARIQHHVMRLVAVTLTLLPLTHAAAQELPMVRVTRDNTLIRAMRYNPNDIWILTRADAGAVFEVLLVDGDRTRHLESNHYLVLLPRDAWGTRWVGWIRGENIEQLAPRPPAPSAQVTPTSESPGRGRPVDSTATRREAPASALSSVVASAAAAPAPAPAAAMLSRPIPEVVLQFAFDRSDLAEAAKYLLATSLSTMTTEAASLSFTLGGHADSVGAEAYNQKLGLARADAVRKYIVDELKIPAARISVSSYGETQPVAPNDTPAGRAQNRRVVVTVTSAAGL